MWDSAEFRNVSLSWKEVIESRKSLIGLGHGILLTGVRCLDLGFSSHS